MSVELFLGMVGLGLAAKHEHDQKVNGHKVSENHIETCQRIGEVMDRSSLRQLKRLRKLEATRIRQGA